MTTRSENALLGGSVALCGFVIGWWIRGNRRAAESPSIGMGPLSEESLNFKKLFETLPGLYLILTPDLKIVAASNAYLGATMTQRRSIVGHDFFEIFPDNPADRDATGVGNLRASLNRVLRHGTADTMAIQKYPVRRPDGTFEERHWSPVNSPVLGADLRIEYIVHRVADVTEFVLQKNQSAAKVADLQHRMVQIEAEVYQSTEQVRLTNQRLVAANAELESFSYSVSHDLRSPLRHIDGFAALLTSHLGTSLDATGRHYLATISAAVERMGTLISDILTFSQAGTKSLSLVPISHNELVASVIASGHFEREGPTGDWKVASLPDTIGDVTMFRQVWANLIENAVKYSRKTPRPVIEIGVHEDPHRAEHIFFIKDNGAGFDMAYASKLFGVFQRLHSSPEFEGTGIGLANVRRIVARHGGRTWAEGAVGKGATFFFTLPVVSLPPT